jgi:hypothetical protein
LIADFGLSRPKAESGICSLNSGIKGSDRYLAPELLALLAELQGHKMIPLIKRMIENDPEFRPTLPEIVDQLERLSVVLKTGAHLGKGADRFVFKGKFRSQQVAIKRILLDFVNHSRKVEAMK